MHAFAVPLLGHERGLSAAVIGTIFGAFAIAATVIREDGAASEMNQRGLRNARFEHGTLMPQEFDVFNFQQWVRRKLGEPLVTKGVMP